MATDMNIPTLDEKTAAPLVHMNGTRKTELMNNLSEVYSALTTAKQAIKQAVPNRRDYYPLPEARWEMALAQHRRRMQAIDDLQDDIEREMDLISAQPD